LSTYGTNLKISAKHLGPIDFKGLAVAQVRTGINTTHCLLFALRAGKRTDSSPPISAGKVMHGYVRFRGVDQALWMAVMGAKPAVRPTRGLAATSIAKDNLDGSGANSSASCGYAVD
jgi:hypothetical protein